MLIELGLGDADCGIEIVVWQGGIQDFVSVVLQVGRLEAAWFARPIASASDAVAGLRLVGRVGCG